MPRQAKACRGRGPNSSRQRSPRRCGKPLRYAGTDGARSSTAAGRNRRRDYRAKNNHGVTRMGTTETDRTAVLDAATDGDAMTGTERGNTNGLKKYRMIQPAAFYFTVLAADEKDAFAQAAVFANRLSPWGLTPENWP